MTQVSIKEPCLLSDDLERPLPPEWEAQFAQYRWVHNTDKPTICRWSWNKQEWQLKSRHLKKINRVSAEYL